MQKKSGKKGPELTKIEVMSSRQAGFTLLEVLLSMGLLAYLMLSVYQSQANSVSAIRGSQFRAQATALAQERMTLVEIEVKKKGFLALPREEKGEFKIEGLKDFTWIQKIEPVDLGCFLPQNQGEDSESGVFSIASKIFEESVRKINITVQWQEGPKTRSETLTQLYVRFEDVAR